MSRICCSSALLDRSTGYWVFSIDGVYASPRNPSRISFMSHCGSRDERLLQELKCVNALLPLQKKFDEVTLQLPATVKVARHMHK